MPTCAEARPGLCPCCGAGSRPVVGPLVVVGHGLIERQLWGPASPDSAPEHTPLILRRYRCLACKAVLVVGPRGLLRRRWYSAPALALALSTYARGDSSAAVRARVSPSSVIGPSAVDRWVTLTRWIDAARGGKLLGVTGLGELSRRAAAEAMTLALAARAGHRLGEDLIESAYRGAAVAA